MKKLLFVSLLSVMISICYAPTSKAWQAKQFTDAFGVPTKESFIEGSTTGVFSNSATKDSPLWVDLKVCSDKIGFFMYEYTRNRNPLIFTDYDYRYKVIMRNSTGKTLEALINIRKWSQYGGIGIEESTGDPKNMKRTISFFLQSKEIRTIIYGGYQTVYSFPIDLEGFAPIYNETFKKKGKN